MHTIKIVGKEKTKRETELTAALKLCRAALNRLPNRTKADEDLLCEIGALSALSALSAADKALGDREF